MIPTPRVWISNPYMVLRIRSSRADPQVRPFRPTFSFTPSSPTTCSWLLSYRVASSLSRCAFTLTQFLVGRLHRYPHRRTQNNSRAGRKRGFTSAVVLKSLSAEVLKLALVKATIRDHTSSPVPYRQARGPFGRMPANCVRYHRTRTGLTGCWNGPNSRKNNSTGHQCKTLTSK